MSGGVLKTGSNGEVRELGRDSDFHGFKKKKKKKEEEDEKIWREKGDLGRGLI